MVSLGTPCDLGGNDLPPNTPPVNHDEPDGTGPSWHPFKSQAQFELADFIFRCDQMSGGRIDELMDILATMDEGGTPPFSNHKELYGLIDAISPEEKWECISINHADVERAQMDGTSTANLPTWKQGDYNIWFPLLLVSAPRGVRLSEGRGQNNQQPTPNDNNKRVVVFLCGSGR